MADPSPRRSGLTPGTRRERPAREPRPPREARGRQRRGRTERAPLSEDAVVEAGLHILRTRGLDAVTMRAVAHELDTGAASLYVYVKGRDELCELLFDRVAGLVEYPKPDPSRWREQLVALTLDLLTALEEHPGLARIALGTTPIGDNGLDGAEALLALLIAGGVEPRRAAFACDTIFLLIVANALETEIREEAAIVEGRDPGTTFDAMEATFRGLPPERYPTITTYTDEMFGGDGRDRFLFSLNTFLDGVVAGKSVAY